MSSVIHYLLQDWAVNHTASLKSSLVLALFRLAQLTQRPPFYLAWPAKFYRGFYQLLVGWLLGIELPASVQIGPQLHLRHGVALVVHRDAVIGHHCTLRQATTIGTKQRADGSLTASPKIGNYVDVGANAVILGAITIGDYAVIGAGAVVVNDVPSRAVVAGNPAKILRFASARSDQEIDTVQRVEV